MGNFINAAILEPPELKYSGVSLMALDKHIHKVQQWLNLAYENKPVPDKCYILGFAKTIDDEFKSHMTSDNFHNIKTKKQFLDKITEVMDRKILIHSRRSTALSEPKLHTESA